MRCTKFLQCATTLSLEVGGFSRCLGVYLNVCHLTFIISQDSGPAWCSWPSQKQLSRPWSFSSVWSSSCELSPRGKGGQVEDKGHVTESRTRNGVWVGHGMEQPGGWWVGGWRFLMDSCHKCSTQQMPRMGGTHCAQDGLWGQTRHLLPQCPF